MSGRMVHDIMRLRVDAFVVEQNCAYPELDGLDEQAIHIIGQDADGTVAAYCRILSPKEDGLPHIGRVVVAPAYRAQGHGRELMREAIIAAQLYFKDERSAVAAQAHLQRFYESLGYQAIGAAYLLDGIPHVDMVRVGD